MRAAYGYTDEYLLDRTPEWIDDAVKRVLEEQHDEHLIIAALHGADVSKMQKPDEMHVADSKELRKVGIGGG